MHISSTFTAIHRFSAFQVTAIWVHYNYTCIFYSSMLSCFLSQGGMMPNNKYEDEVKEMEAKEEILQEVSSNTLLTPLR